MEASCHRVGGPRTTYVGTRGLGADVSADFQVRARPLELETSGAVVKFVLYELNRKLRSKVMAEDLYVGLCEAASVESAWRVSGH